MQVFDKKISSDISLSQILDCLLYDNEDTSVICSFLKTHQRNLRSIIADSLLSERIYQIDFIESCSADDTKFLIENMYVVNNMTQINLYWQIMKYGSPTLKQLIMSIMHCSSANICVNSKLYGKNRHPYSSKLSDESRMFDYAAYSINDLSEALNKSDVNKITKYLTHSLFLSRAYQIDVFEKCNDAVKYVLIMIIKNIYNCSGWISDCTVYKFIKQILTYGETAEKQLVFNSIKCMTTPYIKKLRNDHKKSFDIIDAADSFFEAKISADLNNVKFTSDDIVYMLANNKQNMLQQFLEIDEAAVVKLLPIKDLILSTMTYANAL